MTRYPEYRDNTVEEAAIIMVQNGIKAGELAANLVVLNLEREAPEKSIPALMDRLVTEGKIMEIEYCLPHMDYRVKSMYFPVGTIINKIDKSKK